MRGLGVTLVMEFHWLDPANRVMYSQPYMCTSLDVVAKRSEVIYSDTSRALNTHQLTFGDHTFQTRRMGARGLFKTTGATPDLQSRPG